MKLKISKNGPSFSRIVAGVMNWGEWGSNFTVEQAATLTQQCIERGVTTFDHADIYGHYSTEELFGKGIKGKSSLRSKMQLVSKCGIKLTTSRRPDFKIHSYDTSKKHIIKSVECSLINLETDYLDLLLIHRPSPLMQPQEIAEAFEYLHKQGKVLHFGVSNFTPSQFELVNQYFPLVTNQVEASLLHRPFFLDGTFDQCIRKGISPMAYSTMAAGRFFVSEPEAAVVRILKAAEAIMEKYNANFSVILTAWILKHPANILPIMGSTKIERIQNAIDALKVDLTREEWFMLWEAALGEEVP